MDSSFRRAGSRPITLCGFASVILLLAPNKKSPVLAIAVWLILLLACLWVLEKCFRLLTGRKHQGGLMTPNTLRVVSFFFLFIPVAGIFTGEYRQMGPVAAPTEASEQHQLAKACCSRLTSRFPECFGACSLEQECG